MAKARKEGKPKRNRANLAKRLSIIKHNEERLAELKHYNEIQELLKNIEESLEQYTQNNN